MAPFSIEHETFVLERRYEAVPERVFAAWADPAARERWAAPSPDQAIEHSEADFRVGGRDVSRCGAVGDLRYTVETRYLDIVPDRRIVFAEVVECGDARLSVALITVEFAPEDGVTRLRLTNQIASLSGADMIAGSRSGLAAALDNLADYLKQDTALVPDC